MIKSMTAYAESSVTQDHLTASVTIRSYNSRHLDISLALPESCQGFEEDVKKIIAANHLRGRIEIRLRIEDDTPDIEQFEVDEKKAVSYFNALNTLRETLGTEAPITLDQVLAGKNIIVPMSREIEGDRLWQVVARAVTAASGQLDAMRHAEGKNLKTDLENRMDAISSQLSQIRTLATRIPEHYKTRLEERIAYLTKDTQAIDPARLAQEAAVLSDKADVSEEIVRIESHIQLFNEYLNSGPGQGRKLNFLTQEFNREFNTIGSKAGSAELSHLVVDLKSILEQIREQVQNIE